MKLRLSWRKAGDTNTQYFNIDELESTADFPVEFQKFEEVIKCVSDCNAARMNLSADMADDSQRIKVCR
jgi:plasmid replication initiation protein